MGLKDRKFMSWTRSAHIKKGTHGSSNEISMSVLDNARDTLEAEHGEADRPKLGVIHLFTVRGGKSSNIEVPSTTLDPGGASSSAEREDVTRAATLSGPGGQKETEKEIRLQRKEQRHQARLERKQEKEQARREAKKQAARHANDSKSEISMPRKSMEENVARKKARRKTRRIVLAVCVALCACGLVGVGIYSAYNSYQFQMSQVDVVEKGLSQIVVADQDLTKLNSALETPSSEESQEALKKLQQDLPQTQIALQRAQGLLDNANENLEREQDKEAVAQAKKAIMAREDMIDSGLQLAEKILAAIESRQVVENLWSQLLEIDTQARNNAELLLDPTSDNLQTALTGIASVKSSLKDLQSSMRSADTTYSYINLSQYETYIDKQLVALDYAEQAINALREEDLDSARAMQESYSEADAAAAEWAAKFPKQITSIVDEAYTLDSKSLIEDYTNARTAAGGADDMLREYYSQRQK